MTAEKWVARTKIEYELSHQARPDAFYVGGSLVRVGATKEREWFEGCLKLGLDKYLDAWDVHAYPQKAPLLERSVSNAANETELGVLNAYKRLGMENKLPFILGETGARSCHGLDARRWQAAMIAKMTAWTNSRDDFKFIGFLIAWTYSRNLPGLAAEGDIQFGHEPAEAALYTASALVDGLPYRREELFDNNVQAGYFGSTLMLWRTDDQTLPQALNLNPGSWVQVDVVGRVSALPVNAEGLATVNASSSPLYILKRADYEKLTAF
jgi:hypothetical protein